MPSGEEIEMTMKLGIVGYGIVGKALAHVFRYEGGNPDLLIYDKFVKGMNSPRRRAALQECDLVFVAVPTPEGPDGRCDLSAIEEVVAWVKPVMCVKSTVPPGTVDRLAAQTGKTICFSPEYVGETTWHPLKGIESHGFIIVGGERSACKLVIEAYQQFLGPVPHYYMTDAKTAELCKYMENAFLATKVAFVNQFYDIAQGLGVDYNELRELWLADDRIGRSHTIVTAERGYRGRCLPKDMASIIHAARQIGGAPLLEAVDCFNDEVCRKVDEENKGARRSAKKKRSHR
jgi:UDPglucose 6-dehydrogenase